MKRACTKNLFFCYFLLQFLFVLSYRKESNDYFLLFDFHHKGKDMYGNTKHPSLYFLSECIHIIHHLVCFIDNFLSFLDILDHSNMTVATKSICCASMKDIFFMFFSPSLCSFSHLNIIRNQFKLTGGPY